MTVSEKREGKSKDASAPRKRTPNLNHRTYYFNRELSWLQFNERVLEEALDYDNLLLERVKFLSIFSSNLDEFFMIRVSGLRRQLEAGALHAPPDGMSPAQQLTEIRDRLDPALAEAMRCWNEGLAPALAEQGINVVSYDDLKGKQRKLLRRLFKREIFPVLTPLALDPGHPFPHISNLSINLAVVIDDPGYGERFARVKVPHMFRGSCAFPARTRSTTSSGSGWRDHLSQLRLARRGRCREPRSALPGPEDRLGASVSRDPRCRCGDRGGRGLGSTDRGGGPVVGQRHFGSVIRLEIDARACRSAAATC